MRLARTTMQDISGRSSKAKGSLADPDGPNFSFDQLRSAVEVVPTSAGDAYHTAWSKCPVLAAARWPTIASLPHPFAQGSPLGPRGTPSASPRGCRGEAVAALRCLPTVADFAAPLTTQAQADAAARSRAQAGLSSAGQRRRRRRWRWGRWGGGAERLRRKNQSATPAGVHSPTVAL